CGRPMISKGFLSDARQLGRRNVSRLAGYAQDGVPILGCEPSCLATYKDDYTELVGGTEAGAVSAQTFLVEQFLGERHGADPELYASGSGEVLLHGHCHQKAIFGTAGALKALRAVPGWNVSEIPSGCCGMAGTFGYEREHFDLSMQIGEMSLF